MAYYQFNDPATPLRDAVSFDGVPDDLVPSGFVESRIRQLNTMSSNDNTNAQVSPYAVNTREGAGVCSPVCPRTRIEVPASPPVGHSYPGVRINDNHSDDNGVAWEVASTSAHMFNVKPNLRGSRSNNSLRMQSPTRGLSRFKSLNRLKQSGNEDDNNDTKSGFKLSRRSQVANPQASSSSVRTRQEAPESLRNEQQAVLEMFDMYGVSRPEGWLSDERERQKASEMKTVQVCHSCGEYLHTRARCARCGHEFCSKCKTELVSSLSTNLPEGREHEQGQQEVERGAWDQGVTYSRSLANLSEPVLDRDGKFHRLSHSKSHGSITQYPKDSRSGQAETGKQARQHFRHERRHRLEKSYSEVAIPEQCSDCPTCHVNSDPTRHSICCVARHSPPRSPSKWRAVDQADTSHEEETYMSNSKAHEPKSKTIMATSFSSEYASAEPCLMRRPEYEVLSRDSPSDKNVPLSQESHSQDMWSSNDRQTLSRERVEGPRETAVQSLKGLLSLHTLEKDVFWTCSEGLGASQTTILPNMHGNGDQNTPKSILNGVGLESIDSADTGRSRLSSPGKTRWKAPTIHITPSQEYDDVPDHRQDARHDAQMGYTGQQQSQGVLHSGMGSPYRRVKDLSSSTPKSVARETPRSRDSFKEVASPSKSPQRHIDSSDPSTWKQQLRKIDGTPTLTSSSPSKGYTLSASGSHGHLDKSPAVVALDEEGFHSTSIQRKTGDEEQKRKVYNKLGSTSYVPYSNQAGDAVREPTIPSDIPNDESEMPLHRHICEWRSRYLGLSAAFDKLKIELDVAMERQASQDIADGELGDASQQNQNIDDGIEGLTIIVHRRCKEDLVLNTDLREEDFAHVGEQ